MRVRSVSVTKARSGRGQIALMKVAGQSLRWGAIGEVRAAFVDPTHAAASNVGVLLDGSSGSSIEIAVHEQQLDGGGVLQGSQIDDGGAERHDRNGEASDSRAWHERNDEQLDLQKGARGGSVAGGAGDAARDAILDDLPQEGPLLGLELLHLRAAAGCL
ncbi:hypothetical protein FGB62_9g113 [Gracilaria domingensis]|nr:hypothetical protein FGB62_9g113 [Gracilaria domingensis]